MLGCGGVGRRYSAFELQLSVMGAVDEKALDVAWCVGSEVGA